MKTQKKKGHLNNWKRTALAVSVFAASAVSLPKMIEGIRKHGKGIPAAIASKQEKDTGERALLQRLRSPETEARMDALGALYDPLSKPLFGKKMLVALPMVLENLKHDDPGVRHEAVLALRTIAEENPKGAEHIMAIVELRGCARSDPDTHVREVAAHELRALTANEQWQAGAFY